MANINFEKYGLEPIVDFESYGLSPITENEEQKAITQLGQEDIKKQFADVIGLNRTPFHQLRDVLSGVASSGQNIANALTGGHATHYNFTPENANPLLTTVGQYLPASISGGPSIIGQVLAQGAQGAANAEPGQQNAFGFLPEGRAGGAIENALLAAVPMFGGKALKYLKKAKTPEEIAKLVQSSHDLLDKEASDIFEKVGSEAQRRGISKVPINEELIDRVSEYLPSTRASKALISKAKKGDYSDLRKMQSELWHKGQAKKSSILPSDQDIGEEMLDLRDEINEGISKHFLDTGHTDLNDLLNSAKNKYFNLKKIYYTHPTISKLVGKETRKIPKNITNTLQETSVPMERVREANPNIEKELKYRESKQKVLNRAGNVGKVGLGLAGVDWLYNKINSLLK